MVRVLTGGVEVWKAREVARGTHHLSAVAAGRVDAQVHTAVETLPWGRAADLVEAKVIAADPQAHEFRRAQEENKRYVSTGRRSNPAGLRPLIAQGAAGDVARLEAMIAHLARTCLFLTAQHDTTDTDTAPTEPEPEPALEEPSGASTVELAVAFGRVLKSLGAKAVDRLRPSSVLYLHLSEEALRGVPGTEVARVDDPVAGGPIGLDQLRAWLRTHRVTLKPVLGPAGRRRPLQALRPPGPGRATRTDRAAQPPRMRRTCASL